MNDQAKRLREMHREKKNKEYQFIPDTKELKTVAITSGKGGVGKTNICLNLGVALAKRGKKVVIMDADLNLGNLDVLLGLTPKYTLRNVIAGEKNINEIMLAGPAGIKLIPATSGALELSKIESNVRKKLAYDFQQIGEQYDYLIIDTPAGLGPHVYDFLEIADDVLVVTSPEPTAIIDAYAIIKILWSRNPKLHIELIINFASSKDEAEDVCKKLSMVTKHYLNREIENWNYILDDAQVSKAVCEQQPFIMAYPKCKASNCIDRYCDNVL